MDLAKFKQELAELLQKHGVSVGADVQGDTHGVRCNFVVEKDGQSHVLCHFESMVSAYDLTQ